MEVHGDLGEEKDLDDDRKGRISETDEIWIQMEDLLDSQSCYFGLSPIFRFSDHLWCFCK